MYTYIIEKTRVKILNKHKKVSGNLLKIIHYFTGINLFLAKYQIYIIYSKLKIIF